MVGSCGLRKIAQTGAVSCGISDESLTVSDSAINGLESLLERIAANAFSQIDSSILSKHISALNCWLWNLVTNPSLPIEAYQGNIKPVVNYSYIVEHFERYTPYLTNQGAID